MHDWPVIRGMICDLDGVAYRGDDPIKSAVEAFLTWHEAQLPFAFVTNNSTKSAQEFSDKLNGMGIPAIPQRVITSSSVAADHLAETLPPGARVMAVGSAALADAVASRGFELAVTDVAAVVAGLDRAFTYEKLSRAQDALLGGAAFVGTNPDPMLPNETGFEPGAGSILKAIETASGVAPVIIGKPEPNLVNIALETLGTPREATFMIGDQINTDIAAGQAAGLPTILVRTGVRNTGPAAAVPDFDIQSLKEIPIFKPVRPTP